MPEQLRMDATVGDKFTAPLTGLKRILLDISGLSGPRKASDDMSALASSARHAGQAVSTSILPSLQALGVTTLSVSGALAAVTASVKGFASGTASLSLVSREVGVTVDRLRVLEALGERFNISPQQMQSGLKVLQKNLFDLRREGGEVYGWLRTFEPKLFEQLRTANPNEAISAVIAYIGKIKDPVKRRMAAEKLLGDDAFSALGSGLFGPLNKQIAEIEKTIGKMPAGAEKTALQAQLSFHRLGETMRGLRDQIGVDLAPALSDALEGLSGWVKANGKEISATIRDSVEWFRKLDWKGISTDALETARAFRDTALAVKDVVGAVSSLLGVGAPEKKLQALREERDKLKSAPDVGGTDGAQRAQRLAELDRQIAAGEKAKNGSASSNGGGGWGLGLAGMWAGAKLGGPWGAIAGLLGGKIISGVIAESKPDSEEKLRSRVEDFQTERDRLREQIARSDAEKIPAPALRLRLQETERNLKDAEDRLAKLLKKSFDDGGEAAGKKIVDAIKALNPISADGSVGGGSLIQRASYGGGGWRGPSFASPGARGGGMFAPRAGGRAPGDPMDGEDTVRAGSRRMPGIPRISAPSQSDLVPEYGAPGAGGDGSPRIPFGQRMIRAIAGSSAALGGGGFRGTGDYALDAIIRAEGTARGRGGKPADPFQTVLGYGKYGTPPKPLTDMTLQEAYRFGQDVVRPAHRADKGGQGSSALGAFQIVGSTMKAMMARAGLGWDDKFSAENQIKLAQEIRKTQGFGAWEGFKFHPNELAIARRGGRYDLPAAPQTSVRWPEAWQNDRRPEGFSLPRYAGDAGADLLRSAVRGGAAGNPIAQISGGADLRVRLENFPANTRTSASTEGVFRSVDIDRGKQQIYGPS